MISTNILYNYNIKITYYMYKHVQYIHTCYYVVCSCSDPCTLRLILSSKHRNLPASVHTGINRHKNGNLCFVSIPEDLHAFHR